MSSSIASFSDRNEPALRPTQPEKALSLALMDGYRYPVWFAGAVGAVLGIHVIDTREPAQKAGWNSSLERVGH